MGLSQPTAEEAPEVLIFPDPFCADLVISALQEALEGPEELVASLLSLEVEVFRGRQEGIRIDKERIDGCLGSGSLGRLGVTKQFTLAANNDSLV